MFFHDLDYIHGYQQFVQSNLSMAKLDKSADQNGNSVQLLDLISIFTYLGFDYRIIIKS